MKFRAFVPALCRAVSSRGPTLSRHSPACFTGRAESRGVPSASFRYPSARDALVSGPVSSGTMDATADQNVKLFVHAVTAVDETGLKLDWLGWASPFHNPQCDALCSETRVFHQL